MQPVQLESYKRLQFNGRKQHQGETVSDFAQDLQQLMEKAYARHNVEPDLCDKILLGQFEQGLLLKWKRHLKYPLDSFKEALQQARMAEAVEEQLMKAHTTQHRPSTQRDRNADRPANIAYYSQQRQSSWQRQDSTSRDRGPLHKKCKGRSDKQP